MRVLIVGLGSMGKRRVRNLRHLGVTDLVAFDPRADRCSEAASAYGIATVATLAEGLDRSPDAMIISTPPDLHVGYALDAARRGIHFFTEASVADDGIEELLELLRAAPRLVGVPSCTMRYQPGPRKVRELLAAEAIGRPLSFVYHTGQYLPDWHPWEDYRTYYVSRRSTGACREIVPFELVWLTWALGDVASVSAARGKLSDLEADIDDVYQCLLGFASGVQGVLQVDVLARAPVRHFRLLGTLGTLEWEATTHTVRVYSAASGEWKPYPLASGTVEAGYANWSAEEPYIEEMADFLAAVRGERAFGYTYGEDCRLLDVLRALETSADEDRRIAVVERGPAPAARSQRELWERAQRLIPGGAHTYSKGDDQFPANAPRLIVRGLGCRVWDADDNAYLDWGMGLRSVVLGHAYPRVVEAARRELERGSNFTRPSPLEGELAELLVGLLPGADMVKLGKNGSDVTTAAVRLARAFTGRDLVAICKDNPFYSFDDWFIGTTACDAGIPKAIPAMTLTFRYGDVAGLAALFERHPGQIACVMVEPAATAPPVARRGCARCASRRGASAADGLLPDCRNREFLRQVVEVAHGHGAVVAFDELITGFRWDVPGAQTFYGVVPDLATFGKALANGFSVAALVGRRDIMDLGGIHPTGRSKVFLLSATHGGETHAIAAALATIREMREQPVIEHIWRVGAALQAGLNAASREAGTQDHIWCDGYPCSPTLTVLGADRTPSAPLRTLFLQEMVARGILIPYVAPSFSHDLADVDRTAEAARAALVLCRRALDGDVGRYLTGPAVKPVFRVQN